MTICEEGTNRNSDGMKFALPSEEEIESVVTGGHPSGGEMSVQTDEVVRRFGEMRRGKMGIEEKIVEVIGRKWK